MPVESSAPASFDSFARDYDAALNQGLAVSGEDKHFFARGRIAWLGRCLRALDFRPEVALDYGCGTGTAAPLFRELLGVQRVLGVDVSSESLAVAREQHGSATTQFFLPGELPADPKPDLVYCNGVFHHVPPLHRPETVQFIARSLRPGGVFALWENNPWNPGTRYVMSRIPFDHDAITLTGREARGLLTAGGFEVLRTDYCFLLPRPLKALRFLEPYLSRWPLGAQYQVLARKPNSEAR